MTRSVLAVLAIASFLTTSADAYELLRVDNNPCGNSQHLFWPSHSAAVNTSILPSDRVQLANEARLRWNTSVRGFQFQVGVGRECDANDGVATLGFSTTSCTGESLGDALAVTRSRWRLQTGELLDADVAFNERMTILRSNDDIFLQVAMHELGHVLGLDHSDACRASGDGTLMKSVLYQGAPRIQWPTDDDIAGANFIYPSEGSGGELPQGANSCAIASSPRRSGSAVLLLGPPLLLVIRRWLVRRPQRSAEPI